MLSTCVDGTATTQDQMHLAPQLGLCIIFGTGRPEIVSPVQVAVTATFASAHFRFSLPNAEETAQGNLRVAYRCLTNTSRCDFLSRFSGGINSAILLCTTGIGGPVVAASMEREK